MSERRLVAVSTCAGVLAGVGLSWLWRRLARRRQLIAAATATKTSGAFDMASKLSLVARAKRAAPLRELIPLGKIEGMAQMAGGTPHPSTFPVASYTLELVDGTTLRINDPAIVAKAQQYMHDVTPGLGTVGYVPLLGWIKQHVQQQHAPPCKGWEVCVCTGNSDGFQRAWEALLDPGDTLLVDELNFAFSTSQLAQWVGGRQLHVEPVPLGEHGVDPEALAAILDSWAVQKPGRRFPKALFTIPAYQNPTCKCLDLPTARAVYAACAAHGLAIIEDDPYRLLAFGDPTDEAAPLPGTRGVLPPSYLSVDTDGRVVRCDTFSKFVSPGLRCGFVTAPQCIIQRLAMGTGPSLGVASSVQVMLHAMLEAWGDAGLHAHVQRTQREYRRRCALALRAADEHLQGLARWEAPTGGMFMWVELLGVDSSAALLDEMTRHRVCVVPGKHFHHAGLEAEYDTPFVRISFAFATDEVLVEGVRRLGAVLTARKASAAAA